MTNFRALAPSDHLCPWPKGKRDIKEQLRRIGGFPVEENVEADGDRGCRGGAGGFTVAQKE